MAALLAAAIAGCTPAAGDPRSGSGTGPSAVQSSAEPVAATAPTSPDGNAGPLADLLPRELGGVELHTFAVGQDTVARLLTAVGATSSELEIAYASDHGARFLQLYALRVEGVDGETLLNAFANAAYDPAAGEIDRSHDEIGGKAVSVINQPASAQRIGTFYAYVLGNALLVAQALDRPTAEEGLAGLP